MGAVGAGLSIVSGIAGLSQQSSASSAQKKALDTQNKQQAMQAQLQYLSLKNQEKSDALTDSINKSVQQLAYTQSQNNLESQQNLNDLAVQQALFDASSQQASADISRSQAGSETASKLSEGNQQAGAQELQSIGSATQANGNDLASILSNLSKGGQQSSAIANLLDIAASSGGINEALALLTGGDQNASVDAQANIARSQQVEQARVGSAGAVSAATKGVNQAGANESNIVADLNQSQTKYGAQSSALDASTSQTVANAGFDVTKAANAATYNTGIISDNSAAFSRQYLTAANLAAIDKGAALQSDIIDAQKAQVRSPGFLDYAGVALQGYNSYNKTKGA